VASASTAFVSSRKKAASPAIIAPGIERCKNIDASALRLRRQICIGGEAVISAQC
jgi:hypothetical protein